MISDILIQNEANNRVKEFLSSGFYNQTFAEASSDIDITLSLDSLFPAITYKGLLSEFTYNSNLKYISSLLEGLRVVSDSISGEFNVLSNNYINLFRKINASLQGYTDRIGRLTDKSCTLISSSYKNELKDSRCGHFGSYITLPYFINTASLYTGAVSMSVSSDAEITFSNLDSLSSLPITNQPSFKTLSKNDTVKSTLNIAINATICNAFYLNIQSDKIINTVVYLTDTDGNVEVETFDSGEIFYSFPKKDLTNISAKTTYSNYNPGKPYSVIVADLMIFENLEFISKGIFKSKPISMDTLVTANSLSLASKNLNISPSVNIDQSIAISDNKDILAYNSLDQNVYIDTSSYYLNRSFDVDSLKARSKYSVVYDSKTIEFYKIPFSIGLNSYIWNMKYDKAKILHGVNTGFMTASGTPTEARDARYQNWKFEDNLYKTNLINFSSNVTIDIGNRSFILNGKVVTGKVIIPKGVSKISVYQKDMNFIDPTIEAEVLNDGLYPYNFAYMFSGVPASDLRDERVFNVSKQNIATLYLNTRFVPSGLIVTDNNQASYKLHIGSSVNVPGTYSVQPSDGIVKICLIDNAKSVKVQFYPASPAVVPVGILFADLLTYAPMTSVMQTTNNTNIFSINGDGSGKTLFIPASNQLVANSQLLFNNIEEETFLSVMIDMSTKDKYVTPAVKNIFLSVK